MNKLLILILLCLLRISAAAQLEIIATDDVKELVKKLVGDGVVVTNATITTSNTNIIPTGIFYNRGQTNIGIDSGIVLTTGRAKSDFRNNLFGLDGDGTTRALFRLADGSLGLPGDATLANELGIPLNNLNDAIVLEFDFVALGDSIKFNYVLSSEEYTPSTVCIYNDAFGFFISGPGITGNKNIALIPNTNIPVTITNINDVTGSTCINNPRYYVDNIQNMHFTHDGHTVVLTAMEKVQPCQTYHLKMVIADRGDAFWDSGVFLQAKSLTSKAIGLDNQANTDNNGNSYLVEGCTPGAFHVTRPRKDPAPLSVTLSYAGTAVNGTDIALLPAVVTIPANDSFVVVNINPIIDNIPEGIEYLTIYALAGCADGTPTDSTVIQIRDYDRLRINPQDTSICKTDPVQLVADAGFTTYQWDADPSLTVTNNRITVASPVNDRSVYTCTATLGACNARDSVIVRLRRLELLSVTNVNCANATTGQISVSGGSEWVQPVQLSINGQPWQPDSTFSNLPAGTHTIRIMDAGCTDELPVTIIQAFPDLVVSSAGVNAAGCSGNPDGSVTILPAGGSTPYTYSLDGGAFQSSNLFNVSAGDFLVAVKDQNGCTVSQTVTVPLNDTIVVEAGRDTIICEGTSYRLEAISNGAAYRWTPATSLSSSTVPNPLATPPSPTKYFVTATTGICAATDSVIIDIRPAPVADAGPDISICIGKTAQLTGAGGVTYQWTPATYFTTATDISNPVTRPADDITYTLFVKDIYNCQSLTPDQVTVNVTPAVKLFAGNDTIAAIGQPLQLKVVELGSSGVDRYEWAPSSFLDNATIASPIAVLPHDMTYTVTGTTPDGCLGTDQVVIKVYKGPEIYVPAGFTPNNDGRNDILRAIPVGIKEFRYFRVFNRWGQTIFSTRDPRNGWDGRIRGIDQDTGTYIWMAEAVDFMGNIISRKGTVTIVR